MNTELLQKYISGNATEAEKQHVTKWMQESPENMRDRKSTRLNSSHQPQSRMPSSA